MMTGEPRRRGMSDETVELVERTLLSAGMLIDAVENIEDDADCAASHFLRPPALSFGGFAEKSADHFLDTRSVAFDTGCDLMQATLDLLHSGFLRERLLHRISGCFLMMIGHLSPI